MSGTLSRRSISRRTVLRGAGVALALPWLESFTSHEARAQAAEPIRRFVPIYLPTGAPELWKPLATGKNLEWSLSPVLDPLAELKDYVTVISGLENGSVFNANGSPSVEPAHAFGPGAWLTCTDPRAVRLALNVDDANGVSMDQRLAQHPAYASATAIRSLQVGLSTVMSSCDSQACSLSRSISWETEIKPLYKMVDPAQIFEALVGVLPSPMGGLDEETKKRLAARKSVLDAVKESAKLVKPKLSAHDNQRLEEFFESVREVERVVPSPYPGNSTCPGAPSQPPNFPVLRNGESYRQNTEQYDKQAHASLINDLIVLAFQCDATRVISYMLEDENSEFVYDRVPRRTFTATGSTIGVGFCGEYSSAQHGLMDDYASITRWNVERVADLCTKLSKVHEEDGRSILDNSVVFLGSGLHGSDHSLGRLPALTVGSGGGLLRTNQHLDLSERPMRDFYFTLLNGVYQTGITDLGTNLTGAPLATINELLA